ncbi:MAG TPA: glycosyltransferase family 39 protein [Anaerolineae bacterium]|nr:glycosyltransferase family 39 protein [Anaerolineae bacterium]
MKRFFQSHRSIIPTSSDTGKSLLSGLPPWVYAVAVTLIALGLKLGLLAFDAFPFNADEAIVGLMARHILEGRWPVFFYGQAYMGSLDASLVALGFALFGQKVIIIRVVQILLYIGTILTTMYLGKRIFGARESMLFAGLLMAIPTVNVTLYTTVSLGGYGEALLIGNLLSLISLRIAKNSDVLWPYLAWGFLAGFGFWVFGLTLVYTIPTAGLILWSLWRTQNQREVLKKFLGLIIALVIGVLPWLGWGLFHDQGFLIQELAGSAIAGASPTDPLAAIGSRILHLLIFGSTVSLGFRPPWEIRWLSLPLMPFALIVWLIILGYGILSWRRPGPERLGRYLMMGIVFTLLLGFTLTPFGADPSGRYFLPLAVPMALLVTNFLVDLKGRYRTGLRVLILLGLLGFNLWGTIESAIRNPPGITTQFDEVTQIDHSQDRALIHFLSERGESRGYSNYWVSYPLAFLSNEDLIFVPYLPYHLDFRYTPRDSRYEPYEDQVAISERVAYITTHHPALDEYIRSSFKGLDVRWKEVRIGDYQIFYNLSRVVVPTEIGLGILSP